MNRERHQDDITVPNPAEAQHDGEITCKGYGPPPLIADDVDGAGHEGDEETSPPSSKDTSSSDEETSSPKEIR
ncbi:hypothetical protein [Mycobacterium intracellulare]|uniref:hypothetical protein n=1 Tax=Mycobacterium intracellulare TaxID=1767 RepID=UPI00109E83A3|nr:hypothetical protein [Mycobacterium intracellulare]